MDLTDNEAISQDEFEDDMKNVENYLTKIHVESEEEPERLVTIDSDEEREIE